MAQSSDVSWVIQHLEGIAASIAVLISVVSVYWASRTSAAAHKAQKAGLSMEVDRACLDWGHEAIDALADARGLVMSPRLYATQAEFEAAKIRLSSRLSGLADRGRLFFLNYDPADPQPEKEKAYQGSRPAILFPLILAHYELEAMEFSNIGDAKAAADWLFDCRRLFVSELQDFVDPIRRNQAADRADHRSGEARNAAMTQAAELALNVEIRRPGLLMYYNDQGILDRLPSERRQQRLHDALKTRDQ